MIECGSKTKQVDFSGEAKPSIANKFIVPTQAERELLLGGIESQGGKGKLLEQQESQGICSCSSKCNGPGICSCSCVDD